MVMKKESATIIERFRHLVDLFFLDSSVCVLLCLYAMLTTLSM